MQTKGEAQKTVATLSGLKRWKDSKAGFGSLVCEDEGDMWYFQIPTNIRVYDVDYRCLKFASVTGTIDKKTGKIWFRVDWRKMDNRDIEDYDIQKRYHSYPIRDENPWSNYVYETFNNADRAKKFLGWK